MWIGLPRSSAEYVRGIKAFLRNAFPIYKVGDEMKCPCKKCTERYWYCENVIYDHLIFNGPSQLHAGWICEVSQTKLTAADDLMDCETEMDFEDNLDVMFNCAGYNFQNPGDSEVGPNPEAEKFYRHVKEGKQPLYPGCTKVPVLSP